MAHRQPGARCPEVTRHRSELCESPKAEAFCTELACMATFLLQLSLGDANLLHRPGLPRSPSGPLCVPAGIPTLPLLLGPSMWAFGARRPGLLSSAVAP